MHIFAVNTKKQTPPPKKKNQKTKQNKKNKQKQKQERGARDSQNVAAEAVFGSNSNSSAAMNEGHYFYTCRSVDPCMYRQSLNSCTVRALSMLLRPYRAFTISSCWLLRRMQRIPYTEHATNEAVLAKAGVKRTLLVNIRKRQARFFVHIMKVNGLTLEHHVTEGKHQRQEKQRKTKSETSRWTD